MATITALMVKDLRGKTDLPMMECKQALTECNGDAESAIEWLRRKHKGKLSQRTDKATGEGRIGVFINDARTLGAIVELQCETAPVAKNELFIDLANAFAKEAAEGAASDAESILKIPELDTQFTEVFGKLRENMNLNRCRRIDGTHLASYIHHDGKSGILMALDAEPKSDKNIAGDLCMHTIFMRPLAVDRSGVPAEEVEKVRTRAIEMAKSENKPEQIIEKIAEGKVRKYLQVNTLVKQMYVKDPSGKTAVKSLLPDGVRITRFLRYTVGESASE